MTPEYILLKSLCRPAHCLCDYDEKHGGGRKFAESEIENLTFAAGYAEPGYTSSRKAVLFANWNYFPSGLDSILESYGYAIEWNDEWAVCGGCQGAVRTSPNSYSWQPYFAELDGELLCADCLSSGHEAGRYLESLENNPRAALNIPVIDPKEHGYVKLEDSFESGLHPGQISDPTAIFKRLRSEHSRLLFQIDEQSQFYVSFSVWSYPELSE